MPKNKAKNPPPENLKEKTASYAFRITIRDRAHFYRLVKWLNENVGRGTDKWTMDGRVLRALKAGRTANPKIYIFREDFDESASLYLSLL